MKRSVPEESANETEKNLRFSLQRLGVSNLGDKEDKLDELLFPLAFIYPKPWTELLMAAYASVVFRPFDFVLLLIY